MAACSRLFLSSIRCSFVFILYKGLLFMITKPRQRPASTFTNQFSACIIQKGGLHLFQQGHEISQAFEEGVNVLVRCAHLLLCYLATREETAGPRADLILFLRRCSERDSEACATGSTGPSWREAFLRCCSCCKPCMVDLNRSRLLALGIGSVLGRETARLETRPVSAGRLVPAWG